MFFKIENVFQNYKMFFKIKCFFQNSKMFFKIENPYTQDVTSAIFDQAMFYVDH